MLHKKIVSVFIAFCFVFTTFFTVKAENSISLEGPDGFEKLGENSNYSLYLRKNDFNVAIQIKQTGDVIFSSPPNWNVDEEVDNSQRVTLGSFLVVNSVDERGTKYTANSAIASVKRNGAEYKVTKNGVILTFDFPRKNEEFTIPVELSLENDGLRVSILYDKIKEYGELKIYEISLMPGFGAGKFGSDGYLFIPDGTGFISEFTQARNSINAYRKSVYGKDPILSTLQKTGGQESEIRLPVFGVKNDDAGFLAIIEKGDALSFINAFPPTGEKTFGAVYSSFVYRQLDTTTLADKDWNYRELNVISKNIAKVNPSIKFIFLLGDKANYSGMANTYRDYLIKTDGLSRIKPSSNIPFVAEIFGGVQAKSTFLGFAYNKIKKATTFADTQEIINMLNKSGVKNQKITLIGFSSGGLYGEYQKKLKFESALGGNKGYKKLLKNNSDVEFFPYIEPSISYKQKNATKNSATKVNKESGFIYSFKRSTGVRNESEERGYLISLNKIKGLFNDYLKNDKIAFENHRIAIGDLSNQLYSDFNTKGNILRNDAEDITTNLLKSARKKYGSSMLFGGNAYSLSSSDYLTEIPTSSSQYSLESRTVPFYQMVLHGLIPMSGTPFNITRDINEATLVAIEGGLSPVFRLSGKDTSDLSDTRMNFLYNSYYKNWQDEIKDSYKKINNLTKDLQDVFIISHELVDGVSIITYENGVKIYVNFSDEDCLVDGIIIPAMDAISK